MPLSEERLISTALSAGALVEAAALLLVFIGALFLGSILLPGTRIEGPRIDGKSRTYKLNGLALFLATVIVVFLAQVYGWFSLAALHDRFFALFLAANVFSFALSGLLYWRGAGAQDAAPGFWKGFFLRAGPQPGLVRGGFENVQLPPFAHRPGTVQRIVCRGAVRDLR